jgi:hypothetical protein
MKRFAIILFSIMLFTGSFAQVHKDDITIYTNDYKEFDISKIADDSVYWFRVKGKIPISVSVDFSDFSTDSTVLDFYRASIKGDSVYYGSVNGFTPIIFPVTLVKDTYMSVTEGDTVSNVGTYSDNWIWDLLGVYLNPTSTTTGTAKVIIDR